MPESVSGVDAILDGLRERATGWSCVPLDDAVAAVHAAAEARTQEIVEWLRSDEGEAVRAKAMRTAIPPEDALAHEVARRFPNGGTHAAPFSVPKGNLMRGNVGKENPGPTLICALRAGRPEHTPEAEPVLIETVGEAVVFVLDDGERLEFDRVELLTSLGLAIAGDMGRLRAA